MQALYTSNNYNASDTANLNFVLAIDEQSCGIALHTTEGQLQYLGHYTFIKPLSEDETVFFDFVRATEALKQKYKNTHIVINCDKTTLVPNELFNDLYIESYLRHLYISEKAEIIKNIEVIKGETQMVFAVPEYLFYPARSKYYDANIEPVCASYLRKSIKHHANKLNVFFEEKKMCIIHSNNAQPLFYNAFEYASVDEAAYFILNYYQAFNISHQSLPIILHGNVHPQLKEILNTYAGKTELAQGINKNIEVPEGNSYSYLIDFIY